MTANERRREILERLCVRRYDTGANLAFEFNVSRRTIERDILILSLNYPLYTRRGNGGGIFVEKWFVLDRIYLKKEQAGLLERLLEQLSGDDADIMQAILETFSRKRK